MDAFQGCYKDGTDGTRDCRYFAALQLLVRLGIVLFSYRKGYCNSCFSFLRGLQFIHNIVCNCKAIQSSNIQYKDIPVLMSLLLAGMSLIVFLFTYHTISNTLSVVFLTISYFVPLLYMTCWAFVHVKHFINQHCRQRTREITPLLPHRS